jgi:hypothetical protein
MRIPNIVLDCVGFFYVFGSKAGSDVADYGGTGFFVSVAATAGTAVRHMYLVTAKHVAVEAPKSGDGRVFLRYTPGRFRESKVVEVMPDGWKFHPAPCVDVAVRHFSAFEAVTKDQSVLHAQSPTRHS